MSKKVNSIDTINVVKDVEVVLNEMEQFRSKIIKLSEGGNNLFNNYIKENLNYIDDKVVNFNNYMTGYTHILSVLQTEISFKKDRYLFSNYLFLINHFSKVVVKTTMVNDNQKLGDELVSKYFLDNKEYLLSIGLNLEYYDYCIYYLDNINNNMNIFDYSVSFKSLLNNKTDDIIKKKQTDDTGLKKLLDDYNTLCHVFVLIISLCEKELYINLYNSLNEEF